MKKKVMIPVIIVLCLCIAFIIYMLIGTMPKVNDNKAVESTKTVESESVEESVESEEITNESTEASKVSTKALMGYKITLKGEENMTVALNSEFVDPGATATDADGNDVSDKVRTFGNVKTSEAGIYRIYYFAGGAIAVRTVTVQ